MTDNDAFQLARAIIRAVRNGEPLPAIPEGVPAAAVKHCVELGEMYRQRK